MEWLAGSHKADSFHSIGIVIDDAADELLGKGQEIRDNELFAGPSSADTADDARREKKTKPKREEIVE